MWDKSATLHYSQSTPESWAQFTHDNITRAEHERMSSIQLRTLIDNILNDTSRDMREQADAVDVAFQKRVEEVQDAKNKLEDNLRKVMVCLLWLLKCGVKINMLFKYYNLLRQLQKLNDTLKPCNLTIDSIT